MADETIAFGAWLELAIACRFIVRAKVCWNLQSI
jgi:hypothetical protein